jgi:rhodanese-related sulfurtransferase
MSTTRFFLLGPAVLGLAITASAAFAGHITQDRESVEVMHNGKHVTITRTEDRNAVIPDAYLKTGRHCPPFCIQPMEAAPGVETVGELEVLHYLDLTHPTESPALVIDSRTPEWRARGTIPGSVNIPWTSLGATSSMTGMSGMSNMFATEQEQSTFNQILTDQFGANMTDQGWDFSNAKTLVLYCNGIWCGQSRTNIGTLLSLGYPADKLKWYRGGMQDWVTAGLTTVTD